MLGAGEPASETTHRRYRNAIFDATGARIRQVPITPQRVEAAVERAWLDTVMGLD